MTLLRGGWKHLPGLGSLRLRADTLGRGSTCPRASRRRDGRRVDLAAIDSIARVIIRIAGTRVIARRPSTTRRNPSLVFLEGTSVLYSANPDEAG